jgi:purine-binding chemotaxis protein CheW
MKHSVEQLRAEFDTAFAETPAPGVTTVDVLAIQAGGARCALIRAELAALRTDLRVLALPSPAPALLGITGVRGAIIPVWDLGRLRHGAPVRALRWCAIAAGDAAAFAFDRLDAHLSVPAPLGAEVHHAGAIYPVLDLAGILAGTKAGPPGH